MLPFPCTAWLGLFDRDDVWPYSWLSSGVGRRSGWKGGNLNVAFGLGSRANGGVIATKDCEGDVEGW